MNVIVYYRSRPSEPDASAAALARQVAAVDAWLIDRGAVATETFTEAETGSPSRPALGAALKACRRHRADLLIATTSAIGTNAPIGSSPVPAINVLSVPVLYVGIEIAPPDVMPPPEQAPEGFSLYLHRSGTTRLPMYLCNRTDRAITDVELSGTGVTTKLQDEVTVSATSRRRLNRLEPGCCGLINEYDLMSDGDGLLAFVASYIDADGARRRLSGLLRTDIGAGSLIRLDA